MYNTAFYIIISILILSYILSIYLNRLNTKSRNVNIPIELEGIYDTEKYKKSQNYGKANSKFIFLTSTITLILTLLMLSFHGFNFINEFALSLSENIIISALMFFGILMFVSDIIGIPFSIYSTFVIEEKFGFNKTTVKTFIFDKIKGWLLGATIGGSFFTLIIWLYSFNKEMFWIWAWIAVSFFSIFMAMFYSSIIVPLFNKQKPLEKGELRLAIEIFSKKAGFKLDNIYVINGSKRSTKANAYFIGLGSKKRIVLYDTLISDLNINEIVSVLAHEIGHNKHIMSNILFSVVQTGLMLFIFSVFVNNIELSKAMGTETISFQLGLIAFGILYSPLSTFLALFMNKISRKNEYQADKFAVSLGKADGLISGLKKITGKNLSNLTPHPLYVFFYYSHPTIFQRIIAINKI